MILIVEDNLQNAELLKLFLERKGGFHCLVPSCPQEILKSCREGGVRLVIMDVQLNNFFYEGKAVTGIDLARMLKKDPATSKIPILLATAHAMKEQKEPFLRSSGADGYLTKPFENYDILITEINRWIR